MGPPLSASSTTRSIADMRGEATTVSCLNPQYFLTPSRMSERDGAFPCTPLEGSFPTPNDNLFGTRTAGISPSMMRQKKHSEAANVFGCLIPAVRVGSPSSSSIFTPTRKKLPAFVSQRTPPKTLTSASKRLLCRRTLLFVEDDSTNPFLYHDEDDDDDDDDELPLLHEHFDRS